MSNLMDEQMRTITAKAAEKSPTLNRENLTDISRDLKQRSGDEMAIKGMGVVSTNKQPGASEKDQAIAEFGAYEPDKYTYGKDEQGFYRERK